MINKTRRVAALLIFSALGISSLRAQTPSVLTWHNDNNRDGLNSQETRLTLKTVDVHTFGKIGFFAADGKVDAEPLFVPGLTIGGKIHNVLFVATENDTVYARDAVTGTALWRTSLLKAGETASDDRSCRQITPTIGVTSTPVIDRERGPGGVLYAVSMSKDRSGHYHQRINALSIHTGAQLFGGPTEIAATYAGTGENSSNGRVVFDPSQYAERAALLEWKGSIYTTWTSHCDSLPYTGWVIGYDASTLRQNTVLNLTPNGSAGAVWMSGAGPAASNTRILLLDANGTFDTRLDAQGFPVSNDFGNALVALMPTTKQGLQVTDYYSTDSTVQQSNADTDLGSGGVMLLPTVLDSGGNKQYLAVGAGKDSNIYLVNWFNMGKYHPNGGFLYQMLPQALPNGAFSSPAYFDNKIYYGGVGDNLKAFGIANAKLLKTPASRSANVFSYPGATPSISSNRSSNGILWAVQYSDTNAVLYAYNANDLSEELYDSDQAGRRDQLGQSIKFTTPMIADGHVYVGTPTGVAVFGVF